MKKYSAKAEAPKAAAKPLPKKEKQQSKLLFGKKKPKPKK